MPKERIPRAFNQDIYRNGRLYSQVGSCVACTFTKILEVINFVKTGEYIELSKGYMYGRNNYVGKKNPGMNEEYTLNVLLTRGTVPAYMCHDYCEIPDIVKALDKRSDISILDKEAEKYKVMSWERLGENNAKEKFQKAKECLLNHQMPIAVTLESYQGIKYHSVVMVGYDGDSVLFCDHKGDDEIYKVKYTRIHKAYYLEGGDDMYKFRSFNTDEFSKYIDGLKVKRIVKRIQLHHTYSPSYAQFNGKNHEKLQSGMKNYHVNTNGWEDIGQHFTIFPDGIILTGRSVEKAPAGIYGANTGCICIECLGNFDLGGDVMTDAQKKAIVEVLKVLIKKFSLDPRSGVTYHAWWTSTGKEIGDYLKGHSAKTCPGTNFFGGNTLTAYERNLMPLIENIEKEESGMLKPITELNDIVWELENRGIITDSKKWMSKGSADMDVYWLMRKMANKLRGTL